MPGLQLASLLSVATLALFALAGRLRFVHEEFPTRVRRLAALALLAATLAACVFYPAAAGGELADIDPAQLSFPTLFAGHAVLSGFLALWWALGKRQSPARFLLLEGASVDDLRRGLWIGAAGWAITILGTIAIALPIADTGHAAAPPQIPPFMLWLAEMPVSRKLIVIFVAMTVEEAFFRGFLQTRIGWIPSSLLFALSHASYGLPMLLVAVLIISLIIGRALRQTGRLLPCMVAHGAFDAIQLLVIIPFAVRMMGVNH